MLGKAVNHAEAKAAALAHFLGCEERLHHLVEMLARDPGAGVPNRQADIIAGGDARQLAVADMAVFRRDRDGSAHWHGITGIDHEVHESELKLALVGENRPRPLIEAPLQADQSAERVSDQVGH